MNVNRRALRNEEAWLPSTLEEAADIRRQLLAAGHPQQVAGGIVAWLMAKVCGDEDLTTKQTRSTYRKVLADLEDNGGTPPRRRRSMAGYASMPVLTAGALASGAVLAPGAAGKAAVAVAYITMPGQAPRFAEQELQRAA